MYSTAANPDKQSGTNSLPLSALLSQVLVAFTIDLDIEFERRMPHSAPNFGITQGAPFNPWLVSAAMWLNCMQLVDENGITVAELIKKARAVWGRKYKTIERCAAERRKPNRI